MAIRGPGQPPVIRPGAQPGQTQAPTVPTAADALQRLGLFKGGMDAQAAMQKLLSFLVIQGFAPKLENLQAGGQGMNDASQLAEALKNLQGKEGLPQTGRLDDKTLKALEQYKPAQGAGERAAERQQATPEKQAAARMAAAFKDQTLAAWIKNKAADLAKSTPQTSQQAPVNQSQQAQQAQAKPPQVENPATSSQTQNLA
ncbi:MAG: peptidoglycan-binding domain-containing protein, partial [Myxococcota bacterium]